MATHQPRRHRLGENVGEDGSRKERAGAPIGQVLGLGFVYLAAQQAKSAGSPVRSSSTKSARLRTPATARVQRSNKDVVSSCLVWKK